MSQQTSTKPPRSVRTTTDNPFGPNPFDRTDPSFQLWTDAERLARERWERFRADHMAQMPPNSASPEEFIKFKVALTVALFDAWAEPYCAFRPWRGKKGEFNEVLFDEYLGRFAEQCIEHVTKYANTRGLSHAKTVILETRIAINQRRAHWKAEGYRIAREDREAQPQAQPTAASNIAASEAPAPPQPEAAGNRGPTMETTGAIAVKKRRGPQPDKEGDMRVAEILSEGWEKDIPGTLERLASPPDGKAPVVPTKPWKTRHGVNTYSDVLGKKNTLTDAAIQKHLELRWKNGNKARGSKP